MGKILVKNSFTAASVPAGLSAGELAVNVTDKKLFVGNAVGGVVTLVDANALVTSVNGATGAVQGVSTAVGGTGISVSGATGSVTITYNIQSQSNKAAPVAADLIQINDGSITNQPRNATIGTVLDIIAGDVAVSNTGASTYSGTLSSTKGGLGINNSAGTNGQILVAQSTSEGDPITPTLYAAKSLGTGTGISTTTGEGTLQINNTGVLSFNGSTGAVTGITAGGANTFTQLNTFSAGISASGATFASDIRVNSLTVGAGGGGLISNVAVGYVALAANTDGTNNIAVGRNALTTNTEGADNVAVGRNALNTNTAGTDNIAVGSNALSTNIDGSYNIGVGTSALSTNGTGSNNVALGYGVLAANSSGSNNVALGYNALSTNTTGSNNVGIGLNAGQYRGTGTAANATGQGGIYIGYQARGSTLAQTNEIVIGVDALGLGSHTAVIGATAQSAATIYGVLNLPGGLSAAGTTFSGNISAPNIVNSFNGVTGAVTGITAGGANTFTALNTFSAGISASGATFSGSIISTGYQISSGAINAQTASYSLVAGDNGKIVTMNVATANNLTVPASLAVGFNTTVIQLGAGQTTILASGTTLNSYQGYLKISGQHGSASIVGYTSNVYNVAGNLSA